LTRLGKKVRELQHNVLYEYGLLADFSGLDEATLDRALKRKVSFKTAQQMTFAAWCEQLLGSDIRIQVASFRDVAGQTRVSSLVAGNDLRGSLKAEERKYDASLKTALDHVEQLRSEVQTLQEAAARASTTEQRLGAESALCRWYNYTAGALKPFLWNINEVDGPIREYQGQYNRDYRRQLARILLDALSYLDSVGYWVEVILQDATTRESTLFPIVLYRSHDFAEVVDSGGFSFVVGRVQADVIETFRGYLSLEQEPVDPSEGARFDCHVKVFPRQKTDKDELFHLSCFLHKLFEAMARSGDARPRGAICEKLILSMLLSRTAPCMSEKIEGLKTLRIRDVLYHEVSPYSEEGGRESLRTGPDVSAGKILEHLFRVLEDRSATS